MREIKFRAINEVGKMVYNIDIPKTFLIHNLPVMQITGLYDINGKEIYEGDTVKWGHLPNSKECWHRVAIVEINPDIQFRILYYINSITGEKKDTDGYIFDYGTFAYKKTENALEII